MVRSQSFKIHQIIGDPYSHVERMKDWKYERMEEWTYGRMEEWK